MTICVKNANDRWLNSGKQPYQFDFDMVNLTGFMGGILAFTNPCFESHCSIGRVASLGVTFYKV